MSEAELALAREIGAERNANHAVPKPLVDKSRTAVDGDSAGAAGEVAFCLWRGLDPATTVDRRPVPDPGWDFDLPAGRVQVRGTFKRNRNLLHLNRTPILWSYAVLVWCAPLPEVTVVGWCSRSEFMAGAKLRNTGAWNLCLPWGLLHPAAAPEGWSR